MEKEQLEKENQKLLRDKELRDLKDEVLEHGDDRWAKKMVERLFFGFLALVLIAFAGALIKLVIAS